MMPNGLLNGKRILVTGILNERSAAYAIAKALKEHGAELAFSYQGERLKDKVEKIGRELGAYYVGPMDVTDEKQVSDFFEGIRGARRTFLLDGIVHSIAFALKDELRGRYLDTTTQGGVTAFTISADSLRLLTKAAESLLPRGASIMALTYFGSNRVVPNYNAMGLAKAALESAVGYLACDLGEQKIRVNAISAPPMPTTAARQIGDIKVMMDAVEDKAPLGLMSAEDIADVAVFLASDLSRSITGQTIMADGGYSIMGI